jgi:hypothetical protein
LQKSILKTKPNGKETPADVGLEYEEFTIPSGSRKFQAWWVKASPTNDSKKLDFVLSKKMLPGSLAFLFQTFTTMSNASELSTCPC